MDCSIKILRPILFTFLFFLIEGCSHYSKNVVKTGTLNLKGGKSEEIVWSDALEFKRTSWFAELTLTLDLLMANLNEESPFWHWLGPSEQTSAKECSGFYVVMAYTLDSKVISHQEIKTEFEENGLNETLIPQFAKNLKAHPEFVPLGYQQHKIYGLCQKGPAKSVEFSLPGYLTQTL